MQTREGYAMIARVRNPPSEAFHGAFAFDPWSRSEPVRVRELSGDGERAADAARGPVSAAARARPGVRAGAGARAAQDRKLPARAGSVGARGSRGCWRTARGAEPDPLVRRWTR